jgi:hypothetical protein
MVMKGQIEKGRTNENLKEKCPNGIIIHMMHMTMEICTHLDT